MKGEIYRKFLEEKRKINTEAQYREYQIWHVILQPDRDLMAYVG